MRKRVLFHRVCAVIWILLLIPAYLWWRDAIFFVIAASIYANVKSDWAASEAADDSAVMAKLDECHATAMDIERDLAALTEWLNNHPRD